MPFEIIELADEATWLADRRRYVTSSDVPAILGVSPYAGHDPFNLWLHKTRGDEDSDPKMRRRFAAAHAMEPVLEGWFREETGRYPFRPAPGHYLAVNPAIPWAAVTPDLLVIDGGGPDAVVETKDAQIFDRKGYADSAAFLYARSQICLSMLVCEMVDGWIATSFGNGLAFETFPVEHDQALATLVVERCEEFHRCVVEGQPPGEDFIGAGEQIKDAIAQIFEGESGEEIEIDAAGALGLAQRHDELSAGLAKHRAMVRQLEKEKDQIDAAFALRMGAATYAKIPGFSKLLKFSSRKGGAEGVDTRWEKRILSIVDDNKKNRKR